MQHVRSQDKPVRAQTFRDLLRLETSVEHDQLDAMLSDLDLTDHRDLGDFFAIHLRAFCAIQPVRPYPGLAELITALEEDLRTLSVAAPAPYEGQMYDPLAVAYIIEGSRMGTMVLRKRWQKARDPRVREAAAYFTRPGSPNQWRSLCEELARIPLGTPRAISIIADTRAIFALFARITLAQRHKPHS